MKKRDVYERVPDYWKTTDFENLFDINSDRLGRYGFNLNENLYLDIPDSALNTYTCQYSEMHWPLISYIIYGTTRLAWLLMKLNNVSVKDMFTPKRASDTVKYINKETLPQLVKVVNGYE